jgi:hypothetical protein
MRFAIRGGSDPEEGAAVVSVCAEPWCDELILLSLIPFCRAEGDRSAIHPVEE